jgi:hypothetical protein
MPSATTHLTSPLTPAKVGVLLAVTAEAMYFAGLMAAYLVLKSQATLTSDASGSCLLLGLASLGVHVVVAAVATLTQRVRGRPLSTVAPLWIFAAGVAVTGGCLSIGL